MSTEVLIIVAICLIMLAPEISKVISEALK